jgi:hypothetical protein
VIGTLDPLSNVSFLLKVELFSFGSASLNVVCTNFYQSEEK